MDYGDGTLNGEYQFSQYCRNEICTEISKRVPPQASLSSSCIDLGTPQDCASPTQIGYIINTGASTNGSTRTASCAIGYTGSATSIMCSSGTWSASTGCTVVNCATPSQRGYTFTFSGTSYGVTSSAQSCATGYTGTATAITCQSSGTWSNSSGCYANCASPTQPGYTINAGATTHGTTLTAICATGYTGSATSITCSSGIWSASTGCSVDTTLPSPSSSPSPSAPSSTLFPSESSTSAPAIQCGNGTSSNLSSFPPAAI